MSARSSIVPRQPPLAQHRSIQLDCSSKCKGLGSAAVPHSLADLHASRRRGHQGTHVAGLEGVEGLQHRLDLRALQRRHVQREVERGHHLQRHQSISSFTLRTREILFPTSCSLKLCPPSQVGFIGTCCSLT